MALENYKYFLCIQLSQEPCGVNIYITSFHKSITMCSIQESEKLRLEPGSPQNQILTNHLK